MRGNLDPGSSNRYFQLIPEKTDQDDHGGDEEKTKRNDQQEGEHKWIFVEHHSPPA
jgi:hypothetical protein